MAIIVNKNTSQQPQSVIGRTGTQSIKFIDAPRFYVKTSDSLVAAPVQAYNTKSNGTTPTGWTDLGIVEGRAKIMYVKKQKDVRTGIDNVFRLAYSDQKDCTLECVMDQVDDILLETVSGLAASVLTAGSVVSYAVGQEDMTQLAVMLVNQNKIDGKEMQYYNPSAYFNFAFEQTGDAMTMKVTAVLPAFLALGATKEQTVDIKIFA
jgi:hypothetical protein